jgi:hypothetical protein
MTNDTKDFLMQYLGRVAEHFEIEGHNTCSFRKRETLLEQVKAKNADAALVLEQLFGAFMKEDRITNDKEKFDKARVLWEAEHADAEHEKVEAEKALVNFCKANQIRIGGVLA